MDFYLLFYTLIVFFSFSNRLLSSSLISHLNSFPALDLESDDNSKEYNIISLCLDKIYIYGIIKLLNS